MRKATEKHGEASSNAQLKGSHALNDKREKGRKVRDISTPFTHTHTHTTSFPAFHLMVLLDVAGGHGESVLFLAVEVRRAAVEKS
jgi:hypothetical protein